MPVSNVSSAYDLERVLKKELVVLKFSAEWCGPCKALAPQVDRLAERYPQVTVASVDIDANANVASLYSVTAVPTLVFLKHGEEVNRIKGADIAGITAAMASLAQSKRELRDYGRGHSLSANAPAKPATTFAKRSAVTSGSQNWLEWIKLYFATLLSVDAPGAARSVLNS